MPHETRPNQQERNPVSDYWPETTDTLPLFAAADRKVELPIRCAVSKELRVRAGSQRWELLRQYVEHGPLTNEQAGDLSGLSDRKGCCYWKRCGELLEHGYIADTGEQRRSQAGEMQRICRVTDKGLETIQGGA
jgi:hypothetical protein